MNFQEQIVQTAHFDAMRRVLVPDTSDGVPDPGVDFEGCLQAVMDRITNDTAVLTTSEKEDYFRKWSSDAKEWCARNDAPQDFTDKINAWWKSNHH